MSGNRSIVLIALLASVAVIVAGAWLSSSFIESPADVAARTAPPQASPILVPVERRVLSSRVITRGTARFGLPQPIALAPSALKASAGLITSLPRRNAQLGAQSVLLTASGRPVFVLRGRIPAYRDLVPGISGEDVKQLERGLERLGFDPGPVDGTYDARTGSAVARLYKSNGWEPFGPTVEQRLRIRALERALGDATKVKLAAAGALEATALAVESARATADHNNRVAAAELAAKTWDRKLIVLDPRQPETARVAAEANLEQARAGVKAAQLAGDAAIQAALEAQKVAALDSKLTSSRADRHAAELNAARRKLGVQVPVDEIVFIPSLPVRVEEVMAVVGDEAKGPLMTVTDNQLSIDSKLPLDVAPLVRPGMPVTIDEPALGIEARGVVERVADTPGTRGVDGYHFYLQVRVVETQTPLQRFSLRLTIPIESTEKAVTVVPTSALSLSADGTSRVQVKNGNGLEYLVVEPGLSADGYVEVTPVSGTLVHEQLVVVGYKNSSSDQP